MHVFFVSTMNHQLRYNSAYVCEETSIQFKTNTLINKLRFFSLFLLISSDPHLLRGERAARRHPAGDPSAHHAGTVRDTGGRQSEEHHGPGGYGGPLHREGHRHERWGGAIFNSLIQ